MNRYSDIDTMIREETGESLPLNDLITRIKSLYPHCKRVVLYSGAGKHRIIPIGAGCAIRTLYKAAHLRLDGMIPIAHSRLK